MTATHSLYPSIQRQARVGRPGPRARKRAIRSRTNNPHQPQERRSRLLAALRLRSGARPVKTVNGYEKGFRVPRGRSATGCKTLPSDSGFDAQFATGRFSCLWAPLRCTITGRFARFLSFRQPLLAPCRDSGRRGGRGADCPVHDPPPPLSIIRTLTFGTMSRPPKPIV